MKKRVYLDYAAASPLRPEVFKAMEPWTGKNFANPSALYREADAAAQALEQARTSIARNLGVKTHEVIFVSSSTEANNLAILGTARHQKKPGQIITTEIEHPSILEPLNILKRDGWGVKRLPVTKEGLLELKTLRAALTESIKLFTLAWANSDIGVIQPIKQIAKLIPNSAFLHIDGSQAAGMLGLNVPALGADLFTISSSKIGGPRGIAALVIRSGIKLEPLIYGGGQERELRAGTENVAAAVGFARAFELAQGERAKEAKRLKILRDYLINNVLTNIKDVVLTGPRQERLPNHASFAFKDIDGEELVIRLDEAGFAVGTGSACATLKNEISAAIKALGLPKSYEKGSFRVTLGKETTQKEISNFIVALKKVISDLITYNL